MKFITNFGDWTVEELTENGNLCQDVIAAFQSLPKYECKRVGKVELTSQTFDAYESITIINSRNAIFSGRKPLSVKLDEPLTIHKLSSDDYGVWMSNHPQEICQMLPIVEKAHGHVLIGGLGMGIVAYLIAQERVDSVTVIEKDLDVIHLIKPILSQSRMSITITDGDIFAFCKHIKKGTFDFAFLDTWQGTGEFVWTGELVPLRRLISDKIKTVYAWEEETMKSQVRQGLANAADIDGWKWSGQHYETFRDACRANGIAAKIDTTKVSEENVQKLVLENSIRNFAKVKPLHDDARVCRLAKIFLDLPGHPEWEGIFGAFWDKRFNDQKKEIAEWERKRSEGNSYRAEL